MSVRPSAKPTCPAHPAYRANRRPAARRPALPLSRRLAGYQRLAHHNVVWIPLSLFPQRSPTHAAGAGAGGCRIASLAAALPPRGGKLLG